MIPPLWRRLAPNRNLPRLLTRGEAVPYGIAIAAAFLCILRQGAVLS
jgi:Flp pilus assembly protein protease CpaA